MGEVVKLHPQLEVGGTKVTMTNDGRLVEPPIGAVIKISGRHKQYYGNPSPVRYDYAIIRAGNGRWYTTGSSCPPFGYSWKGLLDWIVTLIEPTGERLC